MTDEIQHFVEGVSQKGHFDSEGSFTVDLEAESHKLAAHRLKNPGDYVLKFLQAAVVGSAPGFEMQVGVRRLQINFEYKPMCCVEGERFLRHLSIGLQSARAFAKTVSVGNGAKDQPLQRLDFSVGGRLTIVLKRGFTRNGLLSVFHRAAEHRVLARRAIHCPVPIKVDGWPIPRAWQPLTGRSKLAHLPNQPAFYALQAYLEDPALPQFDYPKVSGKGTGKSQMPVLTLSRVKQETESCRRCSLAAAVSSELRGKAQVDFVQDGVLLDRAFAKLRFPGLSAVVSAEDLETDLSTLSLVKNESFMARGQALLRSLPELAKHLRKQQSVIFKSLPQPLFAGNAPVGELSMQSSYSPGAVKPTNTHFRQLLPRAEKIVTAWPEIASVEFEEL